MKFRVALITNTGDMKSQNFNTKDKADDWVLYIMEKEGVRRFRIKDLGTGDIIETEEGRRKNEQSY